MDPRITMPILGGIMGPSVPAVATTIAENSGGYPFFFMKGTRTEPRAAESATAEPEIPAINIPAMTVTCPRPPLICPMIFMANPVSLSVIPQRDISSPKKMKPGTASNENILIPSYIY
jgi:hypothetical protein